MTFVGVAELAAGVGLACCVPAYWVAGLARQARRERALRKEHHRARRSYLAAIEAAADDDPSFAPEAISQAILEVVALADRIWRARTVTALDGRPDGALIRAWARTRMSWLGTPLRARGNPSIDLIRVVNRDSDDEDRVIARVRVRVHCSRSRLDLFARRNVRLDERWTLGRRDGGWMLLSVDGDPLAGPVLTAPLIPTPADDTERLREESLAELAAPTVAHPFTPGELVGAGQPPAFALLDLSVVDARYSPALIGAQLTHLVEAWEDATTGSQAPLALLATAEALTALLRPGPGKRLLLRDAVLKSWQPIRLELSRVPPTIAVTAEVEAVRYVISDDGVHHAGNETEPRRIVLTWIMQLGDSTKTPWRLASSTNPADGIAGSTLF